MKKFLIMVCTLAVGVAICPTPMHAQKSKITDRLDTAANVIDEIMATPDRGIPQSILAGASCVVVIPSYKKGAFIIGAQYVKGVATCRTHRGWSAPVMVQLTGGSFGWQIGGQSTDLVLVAMNQHGLQHMLSAKFKLGGDAAASAGPVGRNAQAGTDWKLNSEFLTYSRSKGLFAGLDLTGTVLNADKDDMRDEYGANLPFRQVLDGQHATPANATRFVHTVAKYFVISRINH